MLITITTTTVTEVCKVQKVQKKRKRIDEDDLEVVREGSVNILTHKRVIKESKNKDLEYFQEMQMHKKSCGKNGGFVKGSGYHYDREF